MIEKNKSEQLILEHFNQYPKMQVEDLFKFLFQSAFGCEHMLSSLERANDYIIKEYNKQKPTTARIDSLDGNYSRVHLGFINKGLTTKTFAKLFFLSAKKEESGLVNLKNKIQTCKTLIESNALPLSKNEFYNYLKEWEKENYPAVHHSAEFKINYNPCYRVISNKFITYLDLFIKIDLTFKEYGTNQISFKLNEILTQTQLTCLENVYEDLTFKTDINLRQKTTVLTAIKK